jgi:hypothetical protein
MVEVCGVLNEGVFELFPSGGSWGLLFSEPLLTTFDMHHHYGNDTIAIWFDHNGQ